MDLELRSVIVRYSFVGLVLASAAVWTVIYASDVKRPNGAPVIIGTDAGPVDAVPSEKAPALSEMFVEVDGERRVACAAACRLENYCGLRSVDDCLRSSCAADRRDARRPSTSDPAFARADDCNAAAAAVCAEACDRTGNCKHDHRGDQACAESCLKAPQPRYRENRCVIEADTCDAALACR